MKVVWTKLLNIEVVRSASNPILERASVDDANDF